MQVRRVNTYDIVDPNKKSFTEDLYKVFNRNISYGHGVDTKDQNIDGKMVEITNTGPANTPITVTHNLGRIPLYIDIKYKSIAGDWQDSGTAWTTTKVFIQFTTANMHVRLFIH